MDGRAIWIAVGIAICLLFLLAKVVKGRREIARQRRLLEDEQAAWRQQVEQETARIQADRQAVKILAEQKAYGFPWLAEAYADYFRLQDMKVADHLMYKPHPAMKAADQVRDIANLRRTAERERRLLKYQLDYYENLFPWLAELRDEDISDFVRSGEGDQNESFVEANDDQARRWLTPDEYSSLSTTEKYQRALDRYKQSRKSRWEIGRDFERYVGYCYEINGFQVYYQGIIEGFSDLGRDIVAKKDDKVEIVQCKYWSAEKTIHEKHVFQLYGTVVAYQISNPKARVSALFITSTSLSERARQFAEALGITYAENRKIEDYPCIKCNISGRGGDKIYHLPFDQQYDRTQINPKKGEAYAATVREAESLGFRRAIRWRGVKGS